MGQDSQKRVGVTRRAVSALGLRRMQQVPWRAGLSSPPQMGSGACPSIQLNLRAARTSQKAYVRLLSG